MLEESIDRLMIRLQWASLKLLGCKLQQKKLLNCDPAETGQNIPKKRSTMQQSHLTTRLPQLRAQKTANFPKRINDEDMVNYSRSLIKMLDAEICKVEYSKRMDGQKKFR